MPNPKKKVNLALQGGGAHGAFTWGLLDKLLESNLFEIDGISATSAGSMNAAALAHGFILGKEEGAREALYDFWRTMSEYGKMMGVTAQSPMDYWASFWTKESFNYSMFNAMIAVYSPYEFNPANFHPIREVLEKVVDIQQIKEKSKIKLFICATNVQTGKIHIFDNKELSIDTLLASACLPQLFQAVEIQGEYYWDGGYLGNPALFPLIYNTAAPDIIVFHTLPMQRKDIPKTRPEIDSRLREVSFNSSLMREMRAVSFVTDLIDKKYLKEEHVQQFKRVYMHCIRADQYLCGLALSTVYSPEWDFLISLRDFGRQEASAWIEANYEKIGRETTIDFGEWL